MENETGWLSVVRWVLENPEKVALFLVILAGAWRWLKELRAVDRTENVKETFLESILRENKQLRDELREARRSNKRSIDAENSGRNT